MMNLSMRADTWLQGAAARWRTDERGEVNMVAIVLLLLVVIALAAVFKDAIINLMTDLLEKLKSEAMQI